MALFSHGEVLKTADWELGSTMLTSPKKWSLMSNLITLVQA
jgi:hypothetical protein